MKVVCSVYLVAVLLSGCSSGPILLKESEDLVVALGGNAYAELSDAERYDAAEYLRRKGDIETARHIFEDIVTHNPRLVAAKFKLAMIYQQMGQVTFYKLDEKGKMTSYETSGSDLSVAVLKEIAEQDPWYLPVYSQFMILEAAKQNEDGVKEWFEKAKEKDKDYKTSDYQVGVLTIQDEANPNRYEEGHALLIKGQKSYRDLYESYKNLGNIQKVQHQDSLALLQLLEAAKKKTEAVDLFSVYFDIATVSERMYKLRNDEKYKDQSLHYAALAMERFPGHGPAVKLIAQLAGISAQPDSGGDSLKGLTVAVNAYRESILKPEERIPVSLGSTTVIPPSILMDQYQKDQEEQVAREDRGKKYPIYIAAGIIVGTGISMAILSLTGSKSKKGSFGAPPVFPTPD